ncbi:hypothetical protein [Streptomyces wuyuanensis]|uniref:hypothetical protein n=1 Tax=Streptomyces wuyuanensis TaxID=1196353 RepID=UPI003D75A44F
MGLPTKSVTMAKKRASTSSSPIRGRSYWGDPCGSIKLPDTERNRAWVGRCPHSGYPGSS